MILYLNGLLSVIFFLMYLLSHNINRKIRKSLILLCEVHFALLYILEIDLVSNSLKQEGSASREVLFQLGTPLFLYFSSYRINSRISL